MNYGNIKECDIADGPGVSSYFVLSQAVVIIVMDVLIQKPGIFSMEFLLQRKRKKRYLELLKPGYIQGFTLLGGEPFEPENQKVLVHLLKEIRNTYPQKDIWCYSGYLLDKDMQPGGAVYTEDTKEMLRQIDVLVDGEFVEAKKDLTLIFRGSSEPADHVLKRWGVCRHVAEIEDDNRMAAS